MDEHHKEYVIMIFSTVFLIKHAQILDNQTIKQNFGTLVFILEIIPNCQLFLFYSCHGKSTCQILINNQIFTDPCGSNISKHFEIHYRCIDKSKKI